jgi:uncharacterized protein (TIGR02996 family)
VTNEGFRAAICQAAEDDDLRLVYADWLEEQGDLPRAEFIRLQIAEARRGEPFPYWSEEALRQEELLADHEEAWRGELPALRGITWGEFERGFVAWATVEDDAAFRRQAETLRTETWVRCVALAEATYLDQLLACPDVKQLAALWVGYEAKSRAARALADCPYLENLRRLELRDTRIGDEGVELLAGWPCLANLTELDLRSNILTDASARALAASPLTRLQALDLGGVDPYHGGDNLIGAEGVRALAQSPNLRHLHSLELDWNQLHDDAARELAAATHLSELRHLNLWANNIGPEGVAALAASTVFPSLARLDLQANWIGPDGAAALASATGLPQLDTLTLWYCGLGDEGVAALAASPRLGSLRSLDLGQNDITAAGVRALAESPYVGELRGLSLRSNPLDESDLTPLTGSRHLGKLVVLELSDLRGGVTAETMAELAWSDLFSALRSLGLSPSRAGTIFELVRSPLAKRLTHLDLAYAKIGESEARLFLDRSNWPCLVYLGLRGVPMEPETEAALQQCWGPRLNTERPWRWLVG